MNQIQKTMWSSDLGWVPKSILQEAREKRVTKLQQFETYKEVPQAEAEGQKITSSRFVDKWEESGELRSRLVSRSYESSQADRSDENCARVGIGTRRGNGSGGHFWSFSSWSVLEKHFYVTPPAEYRKPSVVWKMKRYLYGDKRAPREWQHHFEKTMLEWAFNAWSRNLGAS